MMVYMCELFHLLYKISGENLTDQIKFYNTPLYQPQSSIGVVNAAAHINKKISF